MADNLDKMDETFKKSAEEFSLLPSADVWKNIEQDIRKRDRRRRFIIFFFAGAGLFIATMLLFTDTTEQNKSASQKENRAAKSNSIQSKDAWTQEENTVTQKNITPDNSELVQSVTESKGQEKRSVENKNPAADLVKAENKNASENTGNKNSDAKNLITEHAQTGLTPEVISSQPATHVSENVGSVATDTKNTLAEQRQTPRPDVASSQQTPEDKEQVDSNANVPLPATLPAIIVPADTGELTPLTKSLSRWSVAIGISPALGFSQSKEDNNYQYVAHYRDSTDKNLLTYNVHADLSYKINQQVEIFSGLSLVNFKQELLPKQLVYQFTPPPVSSPTPQQVMTGGTSFYNNGDSLQPIKNKYTFLEIPFGIHYNILTVRKFSIRLQPHIGFNMLIRSSGNIYDYNSRQYRKFNREDLRELNFSYGGGVAFQYALRPDLSLELTPGYQAFVFPFHNSSFSQKFQQAELRFSLRYFLPE